ncbi:hypothetical protein J4409_00035 [Candidatus Woesearchaeota archaeon]|nr:hypothetical protein [Candidatus Woesearchaeota archaeon]
MLPRYHLITALLPALILGFIKPIYGILFFIGTFFIDFDHYVLYVMAFKKYSLKSAAKFYPNKLRPYLKKTRVKVFLLFHNIEVFIILLALSVYFPWAYPLFFGVSLHYLLDLCYDYTINKRFPREVSGIFYLFKKDKFSIKQISN